MPDSTHFDTDERIFDHTIDSISLGNEPNRDLPHEHYSETSPMISNSRGNLEVPSLLSTPGDDELASTPFSGEESMIFHSDDDFADPDLENLEISVGSIPILEETPLLIDGIKTPNTSLLSINSDQLYGANAQTYENTSTQNILLDAGYNLSEVQAIPLSNLRKNHNDGKYGRNRPRTQVFSQGRTFTYEKLEVEPSIRNEKHKLKLMPSEQSSPVKVEI